MEKFQEILKKKPHSPRSMFMIGLCLDRLAFYEKSNALLDESITIMTKAVTLGPYVPDELARRILRTLYDKMKFRGHIFKGIPILLKAVERFPNEREWRHYLIVAYLTLGRNDDARLILQESLRTWPDDGFAKVHYGFLLKLVDKNYKAAARYMQDGIDTRDPGTLDGRFFYHLGDAYMRLGNAEKEAAIYKQGKKEGLFLSEMQRSLHNVDRLTGRPWWTKEQTGYKQDLDKMSAEWRIIRKEGLNALALKKNGFKDESETLKDKGDWKEFMLWARGKKVEENCKKAPLTCGMVEKFKAASSCKQGQVKFSVMKPGTHVWAHTGPTNARIRAHLGLAGVPGAKIRVGNETREWIEGDFIVFDDSFEHEVWHEGEKTRLVLIVDMWHPELTDDEKANLSPI
ncbi:unnamed protein product [Notodromas monacha]|uniref:Aspartyl/asparaginy/proline hydroxylase domain-containing protein n=1 Tax=Notodromas monacha TaxID=399045 RepID=A0A7R9BFB5_9CRUS|nr:unnamed protein product [Notodromas monacha]CAG0914353.1 unnamed protein product [Notodromas monacha]